MAITSETSERPKAYLIVAYYSRKKWNTLSQTERTDARDAANILFPVADDKSFAALPPQGVLRANSFDSELFTTSVPDGYFSVPTNLRDLVVDGFYATHPLTTRVGWMAVVADGYFAAY